MFGRKAQPSSSSTARPQDVFREDVEDLYAENQVSAQRISKLLDKATAAGVAHISPKVRKVTGKNQARDLTKSKLRLSKWPNYYWFPCRLKEQKTDKEFTTEICINLPSELLEVLWDLGEPEALLCEQNLDTESKSHLQWMRDQLGVAQLLAFGIHGDGIPCNYDRTESVIMISINLPGLSGKAGRMRIPLVILPDHAVSENTYDDIFEVLAWSMRHLLCGTRPTCRHDGSPFMDRPGDWRRKKTGNLPLKACCVQIRGDWDWMGKCFHLPFHNVKEGCCWLCTCKRHQVSSNVTNKYEGLPPCQSIKILRVCPQAGVHTFTHVCYAKKCYTICIYMYIYIYMCVFIYSL